jgi:hypothetical protein
MTAESLGQRAETEGRTLWGHFDQSVFAQLRRRDTGMRVDIAARFNLSTAQ